MALQDLQVFGVAEIGHLALRYFITNGTFIKRPESFDAGFKRHNFVEMKKYLLTLELNFNEYRVYWITPIHSIKMFSQLELYH